MIGAVVISQLNGSTMIGPFAMPGTTACVIATAVVAFRARRAEAELFGRDAVFDLDMLRPRETRPSLSGTPGGVLTSGRSPQAA